MARAPRRRRTTLERETVRARLAFLRRSAKEMAATVLVFGGGAAVAAVWPGDFPNVVRGVLIGVLLASMVWMPMTFALLASYRSTVGSWGEMWSREVLTDKRRGWLLEEDLFLQGSNVDHVAVTHRDVVVVESKFRSSPVADWELARHAKQCATNVRRVRALLRQEGHRDTPVTGVLVVWGVGGSTVDGPREGVAVVAGQEFGAWADSHDSRKPVGLVKRDRHDIWQALHDFRAKQEMAAVRRAAG